MSSSSISSPFLNSNHHEAPCFSQTQVSVNVGPLHDPLLQPVPQTCGTPPLGSSDSCRSAPADRDQILAQPTQIKKLETFNIFRALPAWWKTPRAIHYAILQ
ncbi:hypothetical protein PS2_006563 [Malus domestica]